MYNFFRNACRRSTGVELNVDQNNCNDSTESINDSALGMDEENDSVG